MEETKTGIGKCCKKRGIKRGISVEKKLRALKAPLWGVFFLPCRVCGIMLAMLSKGARFLNFLAPLALSLCSCAGKSTLAKSVFAMDTQISMQALTDEEGDLDYVLSSFEEIDAIADANYPHYNSVCVYDINKASSPISISKELYDLLQFSLDTEKETEGYFNPLCYGLSSLWKNALHPSESGKAASLPDASSIEGELKKINNTSLILSQEDGLYYAYLKVEDSSVGKAGIDLGGIAKGYATNIAKARAEEKSLTHYFVNAGSSSMVFGEKDGGDGCYSVSWREDLPGKTLRIKNACLSTSSITTQGVEVSGKIYSHIVNPFTGEASPSFTGVTLKGEDAGKLDAYTTALMWIEPSRRGELEEKWGVKGVYYKDGAVIEDRLLEEASE